ncbi:hypothetical protein N7462_001144 [Penicillium macrosclerotiorum]|uniref:uncharacterized protein n=1 Tax=Penicillium macrosclerotiorum TaxID=303699 RepID=UPI0025494581|nr:uncharacterized protein N7462_001144 [Penicillium macrosclerotiorum]KAJ5699139.1 hypothetical protein N7462_001144 [Penicillium macrosclerotiorum]
MLGVVTFLLASGLVLADNITATVNLSVSKGKPGHWASGFIYGIPDTSNRISDHWYTEIGFRYGRAGGAQLDAPARGWIWGLNEYRGRLQSTLSNYQTCRKYGADFIILPHDIWGTDHANSSTVWPGDNGDWSDYDLFIKTLMVDLKTNNALEGLVWDIWNEPDIETFWVRDQQQWIDLYIRTHNILREDSSFDNVQISGPSLAYRPVSGNTWWSDWLAQIAGNKTIPDQYSYHLEGSTDDWDNDLQNTNGTLAVLLKTYGLPERQININEYANYAEQIPAGAAWWISRLERYDAFGLRGNWLSGWTLHDLMANLLTKKSDPSDYNATDYASAPEYQVYKYYNLNMTGNRVETSGTGDRLFDVYATVGLDKVRILSGARITTGDWQITVNHMSAVGLPSEGTVNIQTWGFAGTSVYEEVDAPSDRGIVSHTYSGDSLTFPIYQTDASTAWAFEFSV